MDLLASSRVATAHHFNGVTCSVFQWTQAKSPKIDGNPSDWGIIPDTDMIDDATFPVLRFSRWIVSMGSPNTWIMIEPTPFGPHLALCFGLVDEDEGLLVGGVLEKKIYKWFRSAS